MMNTIPSIFNQRQINHTVVGGGEGQDGSRAVLPVTCLLLNRSGMQYRARVLQNLQSQGFAHIISVDAKNFGVNAEQLSRQFPFVKFIFALEPVGPGDMVNLGMAEAESDFVLVLYDDLCLDGLSLSPVLFKKLLSEQTFCTVPRLMADQYRHLPVRFIPAVSRAMLTIESSSAANDGDATLYAFDWVGLYSRRTFIQLGGADYTISSAYWQKLDLFFRAWLWGERVQVAAGFSASYSGEIPVEDQTADLSYLRFYLKNLVPVFVNDHAFIRASSFFPFKARSSCGFGETMRQFRDARRWTNENRYRFKTDAASLIEQWGKK